MIKNKDGSYLTENEIFEHFKAALPKEELEYLAKVPKDKLITYHSTVGMYIRNEYGLWLEDNPICLGCEWDSDNHPDQLSNTTIERVWESAQCQ